MLLLFLDLSLKLITMTWSQAFLEDSVLPSPQILSPSVLEITFSPWRFLGVSKSVPASFPQTNPPGHVPHAPSTAAWAAEEAFSTLQKRLDAGSLISPLAGATQSDAEALHGLGPRGGTHPDQTTRAWGSGTQFLLQISGTNAIMPRFPSYFQISLVMKSLISIGFYSHLMPELSSFVHSNLQ